ncbi:hypothetical protein SAY87_010398 [Trapa incisa]|uniref:Uncharacterized protein n=1 Tax=Trapa incisa TaxID=236973 RepID=A0AAN7GEI1_9MYRT|nr:hypothetical protein SAY87_010398 [Trapa incisa]
MVSITAGVAIAAYTRHRRLRGHAAGPDPDSPHLCRHQAKPHHITLLRRPLLPCLPLNPVGKEFPILRQTSGFHLDFFVFGTNSVCAFALNLAVFLLIGKTSSLTMNVAGVTPSRRSTYSATESPSWAWATTTMRSCRSSRSRRRRPRRDEKDEESQCCVVTVDANDVAATTEAGKKGRRHC